MSSRVRYVMELDGGYYAGHMVLRVLRKKAESLPLPSIYGVDLNGRTNIIKAAKSVGAKIWVIREPRKLKRNRSRYKQICHQYALNPPRLRYAFAQEAVEPHIPHPRRAHDGANQLGRLARVDRREQVLRNHNRW